MINGNKRASFFVIIMMLLFMPLIFFNVENVTAQTHSQKATYELTIDPHNNEAEVVYTLMVNNSQPIPATFNLNYNYIETKEIVDEKIEFFAIVKEDLLSEVFHNITKNPLEQGTQVKGTATFMLKEHSNAFFSLRYRIKDVLRDFQRYDNTTRNSLDFSLTLASEEVTFIVKIPKHNDFFQLSYLDFFAIEPSPSIESEDGDYLKLVWLESQQKLETGSLFNPSVIFNYKTDTILVLRLVIIFVFAFFAERALLEPVYRFFKKRLFSSRKNVSKKTTKKRIINCPLPPYSPNMKDVLLKEYEESRQMHNYYGKIIWEVLSIFLGGSLALFGVVLSQITSKSFIPIFLAFIFTIITYYITRINNRFRVECQIHLSRCRQIEHILGMNTHTYVKLANDEDNEVHIDEGFNRIGKYHVPKPTGWESVDKISKFTTFIVWIIAIYFWLLGPSFII